MRHKHQYAVRYRRADWAHRQVRFIRASTYAHRYAKKLLGGGYRHLSPLVELVIERQELGPPEFVADYLDFEGRR